VINCTGFLSFARKLAIPSVQQSNLNSTRYCRLFIPRPPLREQHQIAEYLNDRMTNLACVAHGIEKQITALVAYRKSLIHEYVTGQRRVTEADLNRALAHG
jgi:type I restriction enzyme, S subunit